MLFRSVYLNEADEWSRRLVTEVAEWSMEVHQPVSDSTIALATDLTVDGGETAGRMVEGIE